MKLNHSCFSFKTDFVDDTRRRQLAEHRGSEVRISGVWFDESNPIIREYLRTQDYEWDDYASQYFFKRKTSTPVAHRTRARTNRYLRERQSNYIRAVEPGRSIPRVSTPELLESLANLEPPELELERRPMSFFSAAGFQQALEALEEAGQAYAPEPAYSEDVYGPARAPTGTVPQIQGAYTAGGKLRRKFRRRRYKKRYSYKQKKLYRDAMAMRRLKSRTFNRIYQLFGKRTYGRKSYRRYRRYRK